ncbi:UNVERIFIED_CONTAM: hypothetical protein PYX00_003261 [Menopon gallinae]|uniref:Glutaredoxin-like protein n=1 Tax=Menopon gallinae TaxID=328185 RepID=A0AAW2I1A2_9NEOP
MELEPFRDRFELIEVDIKAVENRRYNKMYRFDIPVLFLDGIFLCKHRVDLQHFERRLLLAEEARKVTN